MRNANTFTAHRSANKMIALLGCLALIGSILVLVDFSFLVPEGEMTFRNSARRGRLMHLIELLPWVGGVALLASLVMLPSIAKKRVEIEVSPAGIYYPPALNAILPWERIEKVAVRKMAFSPVVSVFIRDPDGFPIKPLARKIAELNKAANDYGDINIEVLRSDANFDTLVFVLERYCEVER